MISWLIDQIMMVLLTAIFILPVLFFIGLIWIVVEDLRDK